MERMVNAERTVFDVLVESTNMRDTLRGLGLDLDMPVARLRADLAIAQRARNTPKVRTVRMVECGWNDCRELILGDAS